MAGEFANDRVVRTAFSRIAKQDLQAQYIISLLQWVEARVAHLESLDSVEPPPPPPPPTGGKGPIDPIFTD